MRYFNAYSIASVFLILGACKTDAVLPDMPAYIVDPTPESRAELQHAVSTALGGRSVTIADEALTRASMLIIEPKQLMGRDLRKPEQFQLVLNGTTCSLVHLGSGKRSELVETNCAADTDR